MAASKRGRTTISKSRANFLQRWLTVRDTSRARPIQPFNAALRGFAAEPRFHQGLGFVLPLSNLELAEDRLQANEKLVPLAFHGTKAVFVHLAQKPDRRRG